MSMSLKNPSPKVSIVIPVYNGSNFLANSIDCALRQTYENFEVIVVNDGSTDGGETEKIALSYGDRIRYFRKENGGVSSALNYGIAQMTGEYFSWLSHDDAYTPHKLADAVKALCSAEGADERTLVYSWGNYIDSRGEVLKPWPLFLETGKLYTGDEMVQIMLTKRILNGCGLLIPKVVFDEVGGFHEGLRYSQDALIFYQIFLKGFSMIFDGKENVSYRLHGAQTSRNRHDLFEHDMVEIAKILEPELAKRSSRDNNLLYLYAHKLSRFKCAAVIKLMKDSGDKHCKFTLRQKLTLQMGLFYGNFRGSVKKLYYRFVLRLKH